MSKRSMVEILDDLIDVSKMDAVVVIPLAALGVTENE